MPMTKAPQIPIKKSAAAMNAYLEYGPRFGAILGQMYDLTKDGFIQPLKDFFEKQCKNNMCYIDAADRCLYEPTFPFKDEENYLGDKVCYSLCVSINDEVAHGRSFYRTPEIGDVVSVDCGVSFITPELNRRLHLDAAFTVRIGSNGGWINGPHRALKNITEKNPSNTGEIAQIIYNTAIDEKLKQVVSLTGHGIGYTLHEAPYILNAPGGGLSTELFNGLCFCAEPIYVLPRHGRKPGSFIAPTHIGPDGWTIMTTSGEYASHFETTFGVIDGRIVDLIGITKWEF